MPVEIIGEFGTPGTEREWIAAECELAINHLKKVCSEPSPQMDLEIQWQEHDLGDYPVIVLTWDDAMRGAPWDYIARCEAAVTAYEKGGERPHRWPMLTVAPEDDDKFEEEYRNSETSQEPSALKAKEPIPTTFDLRGSRNCPALSC